MWDRVTITTFPFPAIVQFIMSTTQSFPVSSHCSSDRANLPSTTLNESIQEVSALPLLSAISSVSTWNRTFQGLFVSTLSSGWRSVSTRRCREIIWLFWWVKASKMRLLPNMSKSWVHEKWLIFIPVKFRINCNVNISPTTGSLDVAAVKHIWSAIAGVEAKLVTLYRLCRFKNYKLTLESHKSPNLQEQNLYLVHFIECECWFILVHAH